LAEHLPHFTEAPQVLIDRCTARLREDAHDADAYHHRAHALCALQRIPEAVDDYTRAIALRPEDAHLREERGELHTRLGQYEAAIADWEAALAREPGHPLFREYLALCCNNRAWQLATGQGSARDLVRARELSQRSLDLAIGREHVFLNTMGVVLYRSGRYGAALEALERSLAVGRGQADPYNLFFLAMAHHRLGHRAEARTCRERAVRLSRGRKLPTDNELRELADLRAEAEALLASPPAELPDDVFASSAR
jgi:tetratricopeptide (TPR) repeat protein